MTPGPPRDARGRGFTALAPLGEALAWLAAHPVRRDVETVRVQEAVGRVLAQPLLQKADWPQQARAAFDGWAVASVATLGAESYVPVLLPLSAGGPKGAVVVQTGDLLPDWTDAVLPFGSGSHAGARLELYRAGAPGEGVLAKAALPAGEELLPASRALRPIDVAALIGLGVATVTVARRPTVTLIVAGPREPGSPDLLVPLLRALVESDSCLVEPAVAPGADAAAWRDALAASRGDLVLVAGRSGTGPDDVAPSALAAAGRLALHGLAIQPGQTAAVGCLDERPVIVLPGGLLDCLAAYLLLVRPMLRESRGRSPACSGIPARLAAKLVGSTGLTELCPVTMNGREATPLPLLPGAEGLAMLRADGYVVLPEGSEGYAPGTEVTVHPLA